MYRIALLGCGRISKNHIEAVAQMENARIVACGDIIRSRAEGAAHQVGEGCRAYDDPVKMLQEAECDLVTLCTPSGLHPRHAVQAARAGRHVLSEKPLGCRLEECDEAIRACDDAGVQLFVVKQNRFNQTVQLARRALEAGRFGRIHMVMANVLWQRPQDYYDQARWRGTWELDGGCLSNQAAHYVDLVQWFGGSVAEVSAFGATLERRIEAEDTMVVNLRFRSGAMGSINVTTLTYPKNLEGSLTLLGERGTVRIGGVALNKMEHWEFADTHPMDEEVARANTNPTSVYGFGHLPYYRHVLNVLDGKEEALSDGREGRKTVAIIEAAYGRI